ncbi:glycerate kinase [Actinotalea sp.]|uniref:glycerate kinase n=1 Tax=Actinotalea sp. TaxID=1872145 RepID=UPI002C0DF3BE|nr:glycerate kinase [Actinotalea sp.]HQY34778.1 glycerate kinase [Actinotalea sp.]HRA50542.1 glycerate kinase [Actinotalea sp.]
MRILVVPDVVDRLTAARAADALALGWRRGAPHDVVLPVPLGDGGPGLLVAVQASCGGRVEVVTVPGPTGEPTPATLLVLDGSEGPTIVLEAAQALGTHLLDAPRDPGTTSSRGLGVLLAAALDLAPRRVVVGLGGCATHDAGTGLLAGLGLTAPALRRGGAALGEVTAADLTAVAGLRERWAGTRLEVAADVDVPLLGLHGASALLAPALGASDAAAQELERGAGSLVHALGSLLGPGAVRAAAGEHGSGAGGGLGFALAVLGGVLRPGAAVVADLVGLDARVADADLVLTAVGSLDPHTLHDSVVATVAARALGHGVPVVVVAREVVAGRREWSAAGVSGAYAMAERPEQVEALALADDAELVDALAARAERVARTWSR